MKRFVCSSFAFLALLTALLGVTVFVLPDNAVCNSMLGAERFKLKRLAELKSPRIIFIGGSNIGTGFDSQVVENAFHRPVMNMGLHAGLGLIYHLKSVQDLVRQGDLVVVVPEYAQFTRACWGDDELLAMVSAIIPAHKKLLDVPQALHLFKCVPNYGARKLFRLHSLLQPIVSKERYDEHGDSRGWRTAKKRLPFPSVTIGDADFDDSVLSYLNAFVALCQRRGARVLILSPSLEHTSFERSRDFIKHTSDALQANGTPFISSPERYAFPDEWFCDTHYHLNALGVPERMRRIVEDLKKQGIE